MIHVLTGPTGSGKSTRLENWIRNKKNIAGILMPVIAGERFLYSVHSDQLVPVEIHDEISSDEVIPIGKFKFSGKVFDWGNREIIAGFKEHKIIIIDEIGPLELEKKGFYPSLTHILENDDEPGNRNLILVIRESLVKQVTDFFCLSEFDIISSPDQMKSEIF